MIQILLVVVGVAYVLGARMLGQLLEAKKLLVLPVVLTVIGLSQLHGVHAISATAVVFIAVGVVVSIAIGLVRGRTVYLAERDGVLWMRYRVSSVLLWVLNLAVKGAMVPVERAISPSAASAADHAILASIGLGILAETVVVIVRALRTDATVVWQKGEDGEPHKTSPLLDRTRQFVQDGVGEGGVTELLRKRVGDW